MKHTMIYTSVTLVILTLFGYCLFTDFHRGNKPLSEHRTPLYWVAPMDPEYRRDKPGKSPMGMDLVPVYEQKNTNDHNIGQVLISPNIVNNLGVKTSPTQIIELYDTVKSVGYARYAEDKLFHIHPRIEGWVSKLYIHSKGENVVKGQPLYDLYAPQLVNAQGEYILALKNKTPSYIEAAEERLKSFHLSQAFINQLKRTGKVKDNITHYATAKGIVNDLNIRQGAYVTPKTSIMSITSLDTIWIEADVFAKHTSQLKIGLPATLSFDHLPNKRWQTAIDYIYPTLNVKSRTVKVRFRLNNDKQQIKPNMFAKVRIKVDHQPNTLVIPKVSLIRTGTDHRVVIAIGEGEFKSVTIKTGRITDQWVEVLSGLSIGQTVVTSSQFLLDSESNKQSELNRINSSSNNTKQINHEHSHHHRSVQKQEDL